MISVPLQDSCSHLLENVKPTLANSSVCVSNFLFMVLLENYLKDSCSIAEPCYSFKSVDTEEDAYDFIVVGAGTAGSIVAARLTEDTGFKVLLLEAGGKEPIGTRVPSCSKTFLNKEEVNWRYRTAPDNYCLDQGSKGCYWPRGKVFGGTSVINNMKFSKSHPSDFEDWVKLGAQGWSWVENKPYFNKFEGNREIGKIVSSKYHSANGTMPIQQPPLIYELMTAIKESGMNITDDINDPENPAGFAIAQTFTNDGQRWTTARAYLKSERPNLSIKLNASVSEIFFNGIHANAIEYTDDTGYKKRVYAKKEIILTAGVLNTPQILLLSGIGPREVLDKLKNPVKIDLPVGQNLRNHVGVVIRCILTKHKKVESLNWKVLDEYLLERSGPLSSTGLSQLTGNLYSRLSEKKLKQPDLGFTFVGFVTDCSKIGGIGEPLGSADQVGLNISMHLYVMRPRSVGNMTLNSTNPEGPPIFYPRYFSDPADMLLIKDAVQYAKKIFDSNILQNKYGIILDPVFISGCTESGKEWSEEWVECMARLHTDPQNHQVGTAAIGKVVDPYLQVYGTRGLRVIDGSVIPIQPTGNPQGTIMMVAERGADLIKRH